MNLKALIAILFATVFMLPSCREMTAGKGLAETAVVEFHREFNEAKFKELYAAGHSDLKAAASEADFVKLLEAVHRKLGRQVRSTEEGWRVNSVNLSTIVVITQNTEFERGKGVETFTYVVSGNTCALQGYHINSQDMMTL